MKKPPKPRIRYRVFSTSTPDERVFLVYAEGNTPEEREADVRNRTGCYEGYSCAPDESFEDAGASVAETPPPLESVPVRGRHVNGAHLNGAAK